MTSFKLVDDPVDLSHTATHPGKKELKQTDLELDDLQATLVKLHQGLFKAGHRVVIVLEGTDAAGKGGIIRRMTRHLDPRSVRVWPIGAPTKSELRTHYLQRFWRRLPEQGEIAIFDRSWYGRILVERVEGFCTPAEWQRAYREINEFERQLTDDGVILIKLFLHLSEDEQLKRLLSRIHEPTKHWKISPADLISRRYWAEYFAAYQDMLNKNATVNAPWYAIPADHKDYMRYQALSIVVETLQAKVDLTQVNVLSPEVIALIIEDFGPEVFDSKGSN